MTQLGAELEVEQQKTQRVAPQAEGQPVEMDKASIAVTCPADLCAAAFLTSSESALSALPSSLLAEVQKLRDRAISHHQARRISGGNYRLNNRRSGLGLDRHRKTVVVKSRPTTRGEVWRNPRQQTETLEAAMTIPSQNREEISRIRVQSIRKSNPRAATETGEGEREFRLTKFGTEPTIEFQVRTRFQLGRKFGPNLFLNSLGFLVFWFLFDVLGGRKSGFLFLEFLGRICLRIVLVRRSRRECPAWAAVSWACQVFWDSCFE